MSMVNLKIWITDEFDYFEDFGLKICDSLPVLFLYYVYHSTDSGKTLHILGDLQTLATVCILFLVVHSKSEMTQEISVIKDGIL